MATAEEAAEMHLKVQRLVAVEVEGWNTKRAVGNWRRLVREEKVEMGESAKREREVGSDKVAILCRMLRFFIGIH